MSYDEHLISMAGGDGEPDLDAIQKRVEEAEAKRAQSRRNPGPIFDAAMMLAIQASSADVPALLALVRQQQAQIERVEKLVYETFARADKRNYDDDFNRGHCAGYNAAAHLLRAALTATEGAA